MWLDASRRNTSILAAGGVMILFKEGDWEIVDLKGAYLFSSRYLRHYCGKGKVDIHLSEVGYSVCFRCKTPVPPNIKLLQGLMNS